MFDATRARVLMDELERLNRRAAECQRELVMLIADGEFPEVDIAPPPPPAPSRKLTPEEICIVRASSESAATLARRYNVSRGMIWSIKAGVSHRGAI